MRHVSRGAPVSRGAVFGVMVCGDQRDAILKVRGQCSLAKLLDSLTTVSRGWIGRRPGRRSEANLCQQGGAIHSKPGEETALNDQKLLKHVKIC